jgi:hypothetical protein
MEGLEVAGDAYAGVIDPVAVHAMIAMTTLSRPPTIRAPRGRILMAGTLGQHIAGRPDFVHTHWEVGT